MSSSRDFEWPDYLDLARRLADSPDADEADLRTAISRAYYAAFHVAVSFLETEGHRFTHTGEDHRKVWHTLIRLGRPRQAIGTRGRALLNDRRKADYRRPFPGDVRKQTELALVSAEYVIQELGRIVDAKGGRA